MTIRTKLGKGSQRSAHLREGAQIRTVQPGMGTTEQTEATVEPKTAKEMISKPKPPATAKMPTRTKARVRHGSSYRKV
jgi:hypothetical protein